MAEPAQIRQALTRLQFSNEAGLYITNVQAMNSLAELALLTDEEVENLCKVTRRPGGTIPNPQAHVAGQPATIPNPGITVPLVAENNLKLTCFFLRYKQRTSRTLVAAEITLANIRAFRDYRTYEEGHEDPDAPEINSKDWPRTIEALEEYLRDCLGTTKIPLAYVVRVDEAVPGDPDPTDGYDSKQDELIARAPIRLGNNNPTETFKSDNDLVWAKLAEITRNHECWTYVKPAQRARDGRRAFFGLKNHYLGPNNVDNMSTQAEQRLQALSFNGETRRWTMEKYVRAHMDQHNILEGLTEHGYAGIDDRSKVRHLLNGIKTSQLDSVKARILSDANLRSDFDACVNLLNDFLTQDKAMKKPRESTIAAVHTAQPGKDETVKPDMTVEDRYYSKKEYDKLPQAKKLALKLKRQSRGHKPGPKKPTGGNDLNLSKRTIKALVTAMKKAGSCVVYQSHTLYSTCNPWCPLCLTH